MPRRPRRSHPPIYFAMRELGCEPLGERLDFMTGFATLEEARAFAQRVAALHGSNMEICRRDCRRYNDGCPRYTVLERIEAPWRLTHDDLIRLRVAFSVVHGDNSYRDDPAIRAKAEALVAAFREFASLVRLGPLAQPEPDSPQPDTIPGALRQE